MDTKGQLKSFRHDCYYEAQPFDGDRYNIVAYTLSTLPDASTSAMRRLHKLGFTTTSRVQDVWQVDEDELLQGPFAWQDETVMEAYPARAWQPPGDGEVLAMDTSGEKADDGAQEPPSRGRQ